MAAREGYAELQAKTSEARRAWKRSMFWTGFAIVLAGLIGLLAGEALIDLLMPLPSGVRAVLLIGVVGGIGYLIYKFLVQPLRSSLTLRDVALNVERKHPDLEDRLVSALQFGERESADPIEAHMLEKLVADAAKRTKGVDFKATIDQNRKRKHVGIAIAALVFCGLFALLLPSQLNTTLKRILIPWEKTEHVLATKFLVEPGDARILRGKSLPINVEVRGRSADKVELIYATPPSEGQTEASEFLDGEAQRVNMMAIEGDKGKFGYEIFNINETMQYYVKANGIQSAPYTVEVFEMPKVIAIQVAYTYPEYTQLKPIVQQGDGNVRAVVGTQAEIRITTNKPIQSGTITEKDAIPMVISEGRTLTSTLDVLQDGKYGVALFCVDGFKNQIPIEYSITALPDNPPEVAIKHPGQDIKATKLEEVQVIAEAADDYGIERLALKYSVGSGEAEELMMETVGIQEKKLISGTYTFYLEEVDVEPGEVISYYAQATDNNTRTGPGVATSEIYFIEVRPFNERFEEVEAQAGSNVCTKLIALQKQIIRETWKQIHSRPATLTDNYKAAVKKTGEKQTDLKGKAQRFVNELSMSMRTAAVDPEILISMEDAIDKMGEASDELYAIKPRSAMPHEQDALELLVKVAMEMPKALARMRQDGNQETADNLEVEMEDLQSVFEQDQNELDDQMRNQTQEMLDQAREMLARQQQLTERSQQMGRQGQPSQQEMQQNSRQQGQMAQQAGQMAQQMGQAGQQMGQGGSQGETGGRMAQASKSTQEASEEMAQAAESLQQENPQMSAAKGRKAEGNLQQAIEQLEKVAAQFTDEALDDVLERLDRLTEKQSEIQEETETLENHEEQNSLLRVEDLRRASELANQQRELRQDLENLQRDLSNLQEQLRENEPDADRNVRDAQHRIAEEQTSDNMSSAQRGLQWRSFASSRYDRQKVLDTLQTARDDLQQARANMADTEEERLEAVLEQLQGWENQMRDIQRELEAMANREAPLTPEQERRQEQLSELQEQLRERVQSTQRAQQPGDKQQDGQQPGQENGQDARQARAATESNRRIEELWLGLLDSMQPRRGSRRAPSPNYDRTLQELANLTEALEERLTEIQEKKRLAQVLKEDVPPEYRTLVDGYYESLAQ